MEVIVEQIRRRRGNNEGSIKKRRDGRWEAQYSVKRPTDGKTVRRSLYGKSRQEVQEKLQEILVSIHQDEYISKLRNLFRREWFRRNKLTLPGYFKMLLDPVSLGADEFLDFNLAHSQWRADNHPAAFDLHGNGAPAEAN